MTKNLIINLFLNLRKIIFTNLLNTIFSLVIILSIAKYTLLPILKVIMEHTEIWSKVIQTDQEFIITSNRYALNMDLTLNAQSKSSWK